MNRQQHMLMSILQKIRVFDGLEINEAQTLLAFSYMKQYEKGDMVYQKGDPSNDMFVLIMGRLKVMGEDDRVLVDIPPGTSTGEMGMFTKMPRSATIVAADKSAGLVFSRDKLNAVMASEVHLKGTILQNVVGLLAERLVEADRKMEEYMKKVVELGGEI